MLLEQLQPFSIPLALPISLAIPLRCSRTAVFVGGYCIATITVN
jgi:hypothetical protein